MSVETTNNDNITDQAIADSNAYDIIRTRLDNQGKELEQATSALNQARLAEFKSMDLEVIGRMRVRTENNCIARDIVQIGDLYLFGYNVYIGLKKETKIEDVFMLYELQQHDDQYDLQPASLDNTFLKHPSFSSDFRELYAYYKHAGLLQLVVKNNKLLAAFQIGERITDIRVFRWNINNKGEAEYIDNRGERDIALPNRYDFEWVETRREDTINGRFPHINILDALFVETTHGDLTVKVENNTDTGKGIYSEPVEEATQSIDDAAIAYVNLGNLILLRMLPYREETERFLIYNRITNQVTRLDAIGQACIQLPEDHGLIFPGGIYLQNGEVKTFNDDMQGMQFKRSISSPNGEDVFYLFYNVEEGKTALFAYNLIEKNLKNPIFAHGYAIAPNGQMVIFNAESEEPTRIHPMQIWQTPFVSDEYASQQPEGSSFYARIGNAELVRGISDLYSVVRSINHSEVSKTHYNQLVQDSHLFERYYWLDSDELNDIRSVLYQIIETSELVLDEFEKVESIRSQALQALDEAEEEQKAILSAIMPNNWEKIEDFVDSLTRIRHQRGHLITIRDYRYINVERITELDEALQTAQDELGEDTIKFLASDKALAPYVEHLEQLESELAKVQTLVELGNILEPQTKMAADLDLLSELMTTLKIDDATIRTKVIDDISSIYARLNQLKARTQHRKKDIGSAEAVAQFAVQFKLFSQSVTNALGLANTPDKTDEQLARLLMQLEELEGQFSEHDEFLTDIINKREEVHEAFESHKQSLINERQRRAQNLMDAAQRIIQSIQRRTARFTEMDELNTFYASDPLVMKIREITEQLRELDDSVKADDLDSSLKSHKDQAIRALRDKQDIYEDGGKLIKIGSRHRFSVTEQELDLTILPRNGELYAHLSGTDFFEPINSKTLNDLREFWDMSLESETNDFYRAAYLAGLILTDAESGQADFTHKELEHLSLNPEKLLEFVQKFATPRYKEGYEKGIHDHDASQFLANIIPVREKAGLLRFDPKARAIALVFWHEVANEHSNWLEQAKSAQAMQQIFNDQEAVEQLQQQITLVLSEFLDTEKLTDDSLETQRAAAYLTVALAEQEQGFAVSQYAHKLKDELLRSLDVANSLTTFNDALENLANKPQQQWQYIEAWLTAMLKHQKANEQLQHYIPEAIALISLGERLKTSVNETSLDMHITDLMGEHSSIVSQDNERFIDLSLDQFLLQFQHHREHVVPAYRHYLKTRADIIDQEREQLRLNEFKPRPLSSFVRNRLLNESYLPLIGDNLAKQMGTVGEDKRTDLMGMLMLISPPGYGKTTLMEYVASRLGLIFMKINCPSLGHNVVSLDPAQAPDAAAAQELEKLNLSFEMANNVMLYLDDIQHTNPEFLQKFISLADGTRRVEGIWRGKSRTYDMRGKRFCIIMAGNPYTESGDVFKIPDMLANRADVYNLGEVLGDKEEIFALSYIENTLTANKVLAPLATRDMDDIYKLIDLAKGKDVSTTDLSHTYSAAELKEITDVFKKLFVAQDVILKVNQQYIASAAQSDEYRTEPPFKLQGSYRNMNKLAEKISAVMSDEELMQLLADHYQGEAQLLTTGAEENLLKLAELRGNMTEEQKARWETIKQEFRRNRIARKADVEIGLEIASKLSDLNEHFRSSQEAYNAHNSEQLKMINLAARQLYVLNQTLQKENTGEELQQVIKEITQQLISLEKTIQVSTKKTDAKPEDKTTPLLSNIAKQLQNIDASLGKQHLQSELGKHLQDIAEGLQFMGQELSEVSEASQKKLNWLTRFNKVRKQDL
jgi:MoxR-like ATPase